MVFWNNLVAYSWYSADKWIDVLHKLFYFTTEVLRLWIRIHFELFKRIHFEMPVPLLLTDFFAVGEAAVGWFHWMCRCYYTWSSIEWEFLWHLWGNNHCFTMKYLYMWICHAMAYPNMLGSWDKITRLYCCMMHLMNVILIISCHSCLHKVWVLICSLGHQNKGLCNYWLENPAEVDDVSPGIDGQLVLWGRRKSQALSTWCHSEGGSAEG